MMRKCKVCGKRFELEKSNRYDVVKNPEGLQALTQSSTTYEAFDCPKCGCQNIVGIREIGDSNDEYIRGYTDAMKEIGGDDE